MTHLLLAQAAAFLFGAVDGRRPDPAPLVPPAAGGIAMIISLLGLLRRGRRRTADHRVLNQLVPFDGADVDGSPLWVSYLSEEYRDPPPTTPDVTPRSEVDFARALSGDRAVIRRLREVAAVAIAVPTLVVLAADDVVRRVRRWWATPPDLDDVARYRGWESPFVASSGGGVRTETLPKDGTR